MTAPLSSELTEALRSLRQVASELLRIAREKLAALRSARADDLHALAAAEAPLIAQLAAGEQARRAAIARLAQAVHRPVSAETPVREITKQLPEREGADLLAASDELRAVLENLRHSNGLIADVARDLQGIVRDVLLEALRRTQQCVAYGPDGRHAFRGGEACVEAVA